MHIPKAGVRFQVIPGYSRLFQVVPGTVFAAVQLYLSDLTLMSFQDKDKDC